MARNYSIEGLAPSMKRMAEDMMQLLGPGWVVWETHRAPLDQYQMFLKGVSKAGPMQSPHQYGLAIDVVPLNDNGKPFWPKADDLLWETLADAAEKVGLHVPISWDKCHVEHKSWKEVWARIS